MANQKPDGLTAIFEQAATGLENMAELLSAYYKSLTSRGIPETLASSLVLDYQRQILRRTNQGSDQS